MDNSAIVQTNPLKKKGIALLLSGFALIIASVVLIAVALHLYDDTKAKDVLSFLIMSLFALPSVGALLAYGGILRMITRRAEPVYLKAKLTLCTLALSAVGGMGLTSGLCVFSMAAFGESSKYPNRYPVFLAFACLCLIVFIALIVLYFAFWITSKDEEGEMISIRVLLSDILRSVLALPGCVALSLVGMGVLERLFVK